MGYCQKELCEYDADIGETVSFYMLPTFKVNEAVIFLFFHWKQAYWYRFPSIL